MARTTVKQLTGSNIQVLRDFADDLQVDDLGKTIATFEGSAQEVLERIEQVRSAWHGRSFENRAIVAVRNKVRDYIEGGRYAKYVSETEM